MSESNVSDVFRDGRIAVNSAGTLSVEQVALNDIASKVGTPVYVYSEAAILESLAAYQKAFSSIPTTVCVSVKANSNLTLLKILANAGAGFDIVSGGELARVIKAGGDPRNTVFAGVGKSDAEIMAALEVGICMFNVESVEELSRINELAGALKTTAPVSLRVNPDVDAKTHAYISTGLEGHKFGIALPDAEQIYARGKDFPNVVFRGVDCHIGSMVTDLSAFGEAFNRVGSFVERIQKHTQGTLEYLDIGGGLAVRYEDENVPRVQQYADVVVKSVGKLGLKLILEPGRSIFANSGLLLSRVIYVKANPKKRFVILDAGMNDLIRPALYEAFHEIRPVQSVSSRDKEVVDIVGPICESGDCFAHDREMERVERGELVAILSAGAYGMTMASNYNTRARPAEVLVSGKSWRLIRKRENIEELIAQEVEFLQDS